jgi:hypothetical protein
MRPSAVNTRVPSSQTASPESSQSSSGSCTPVSAPTANVATTATRPTTSPATILVATFATALKGVRRNCRLQPWVRSMATDPPAAVADIIAPYNAMEIMM